MNADLIEARILADLRPVRRLARPWKRGLGFCAAGLLVAAAIHFGQGVRHDARLLGPLVLWGLSALQAGYGVLLVAAALRESVPGRGLTKSAAWLLVAAGVGLALAITLLTWFTHASQVPAAKTALYWHVCLEEPTLAGLPSLAVALLLAFRAYPMRPALVGALAGLGAGLLTDGAWRTYCEVSAPSHVIPTHLASVLLLTLVGTLVAVVAGRRRGKRL